MHLLFVLGIVFSPGAGVRPNAFLNLLLRFVFLPIREGGTPQRIFYLSCACVCFFVTLGRCYRQGIGDIRG